MEEKVAPGVLLEIRDVTKTYGSGHTALTAVAHACMSVREGEFVSLLGPSGSGKTTLLSMIGGLLTPTTGKITVGDTEVTALCDKERTRFRAERVGFVFQSVNLVPFLTARENLLVMDDLRRTRRGRRAAAARADALLDELGLAERAGNLPEQLSGGERQRVAIGRALMNDPALVLVDEPTAALDTKLGKQVVDMLRREIKSRGKTGIMVTHDTRMTDFTDRRYEMLDGRLTEAADAAVEGSPQA